MSFDLYIGGCLNGKKAPFPRALLARYFGEFVSRREPRCLTLSFEGGEECLLFCDDEELVEICSINRPGPAPALYQAIFELLRSANLVLFLPGECPPLVGRAETITHVPADMVEGLGQAVVLGHATEILEWIHRA
jgi:hypothetical protein